MRNIPYGTPRYANGSMPGSFGFTGQREDAATGLDYFLYRYYDPTAGQFISPDSVLADNGADLLDLSRYAYVEGNPSTKTDPTGHCPFCITVAVGALVGAAVGAVASVASQAASGHCCDWGSVGREAAIGAVSGAVTGLLGPAAGAAARVAVGAAVSAGEQVARNKMEGKPLGDGVALAAGIGGATGALGAPGVGRVMGKLASRAGSGLSKLASKVMRGGSAMCKLSFSPDTLVATLDGGQQAIASLQEGDAVEAYDPETGQASTQTVEHVWINHDDDLIDLTLRIDAGSQVQPATDISTKQQDAEVAAHGLRAPPTAPEIQRKTASASDETVHTTSKHPWLTADRGWVTAGDLQTGERVIRLDGSTATITAVRVVPGAATMYNLQVSQVHTFVVGAGQYVVHNSSACKLPPVKAGDFGSYGNLISRARSAGKVGQLDFHHFPQKALKFFGNNTRREGFAVAMDPLEHQLTRTYGWRGRITAALDKPLLWAGGSFQKAAFRGILAREIRDIRGITGSKYNAALRASIQYYRTRNLI